MDDFITGFVVIIVIGVIIQMIGEFKNRNKGEE